MSVILDTADDTAIEDAPEDAQYTTSIETGPIEL
jgi:hypothetical protein